MKDFLQQYKIWLKLSLVRIGFMMYEAQLDFLV